MRNKQHTFARENIMSEKQLTKLLKTIDSLKDCRHDYLMFCLIANTGLRISECSNLDWSHINQDERFLTVLEGKGSKQRTVYFGDKVIKLLTEIQSSEKSGAVFTGQRGRLTPSGITKRFNKHRSIAGLPDSITTHSLRHRYACYLLNNGVDIAVIRDQLGHSSIQVTSLYLHLTERGLEKLRAFV